MILEVLIFHLIHFFQIFLGNNNYNRPRFKLEKLMSDYGFKNYQLNDTKHFDHTNITISNDILNGYMLSIKQ